MGVASAVWSASSATLCFVVVGLITAAGLVGLEALLVVLRVEEEPEVEYELNEVDEVTGSEVLEKALVVVETGLVVVAKVVVE